MREKFEQSKEQKEERGLLRNKARNLLRAEINPLEDKEFQGFLKRHFITEGDAQKVIDEEKEKLQKKNEASEKEGHYLKTEK